MERVRRYILHDKYNNYSQIDPELAHGMPVRITDDIDNVRRDERQQPYWRSFEHVIERRQPHLTPVIPEQPGQQRERIQSGILVGFVLKPFHVIECDFRFCHVIHLLFRL
ncbi:hypothetical protein D3C81_1864270 [compost metagenome]